MTSRPLGLPFDPIERAGQLWTEHFGSATAMQVATSVMRAQQLLLARFDALLKPHGLTFARYEALVLLYFSRSGALPLSVVVARVRAGVVRRGRAGPALRHAAHAAPGRRRLHAGGAARGPTGRDHSRRIVGRPTICP